MTSITAKFASTILWPDYAGATVSIVRQRLASSFRNVATKIVLHDQVVEWNATVTVGDIEILKRWIPGDEVRAALLKVAEGACDLLGDSMQLMHLKEGLTPRAPYTWHEDSANLSASRGAWPSRSVKGSGSHVAQIIPFAEAEAARRQLGPKTGGELSTWDDVSDFLEIWRRFTEGLCIFEFCVPTYARLDRFDPPRTFYVAASTALAAERVGLFVGRAPSNLESVADRHDEHGESSAFQFSARANEIITPRSRFQVVLDGSAVQEGSVGDVIDNVEEPIAGPKGPSPVGLTDADLAVLPGAPVWLASAAPLWTLDVSFVHDAAVRAVLERNVRELGVAAREDLHTAALVLAGAIGEGVLYDALVHRKARSMQATTAPRQSKNGPVKDIETDKWDLVHYIRVAEELGLLGPNVGRMADAVLRGFRNLIHPKVQVETRSVPDQAEMRASQAWLEALVRDVKKAP